MPAELELCEAVIRQAQLRIDKLELIIQNIQLNESQWISKLFLKLNAISQ